MPCYSRFTHEESEGQKSEVPNPVTQQVHGNAKFQTQEIGLNHYTTSNMENVRRLENPAERSQTFSSLNPT